MTYCVAVSVNSGIVLCSDSRTNAGIDMASVYSKMFKFELSNERQFVVLSAGNLATSQATMHQMKKDIRQNAVVSLNTVASLSDAADYLGEVCRNQMKKHDTSGPGFGASFLLGGQVMGNDHGVALVYPAGNHITSTVDTPYLQIGESKYGKPILDRIINQDTSLETAALCVLVSMDSTMRSNLTVGPPIEVMLYTANSFVLQPYHRFEEDNEFLRDLKKAWDHRLKEAFNQLPHLTWAQSRQYNN
ncbi:MAG: peptidase [SAR86 cluster bacterium]|uniref:Peptidase n=1 Tax=SAR86 cluster bacterium TaxID=2030880 RepID=A0A2A5CG84_9GAMM|nr:MAG: peptidase [SAR86 cluster bacterium]